MSVVATSATRAQPQTDEAIITRIRHQTQANTAYYAIHPEQIDRRLRELDREWNIERWLEVNSAALALLGLTLAFTRGRWWLVLPLAARKEQRREQSPNNEVVVALRGRSRHRRAELVRLCLGG